MKRDMSVVGIDIAKRVFHLVGMDERGKIVMRKRCSRGEGFCRKVRFLGQNPKIGCQKFNDLQTHKLSKKQLCDRTVSLPQRPAVFGLLPWLADKTHQLKSMSYP